MIWRVAAPVVRRSGVHLPNNCQTVSQTGVIIYHNDDPCGSGKTYSALREIAMSRCRTVVAVDRREVIPDRVYLIQKFADEFGTRPTIIEIISNDDAERRVETVRRRIEDCAGEHEDNPHVVAFVTHAGLMSAKLGGFAGWNLIIDEAPNTFSHVALPVDRIIAPSLAHHYELVGCCDGQSAIRHRGDLSATDFSRYPHLRDFHHIVLTGVARCDIGDWSELQTRATLAVWRLWEAKSLSAFDDVRILADSFHGHLTGLLWAQEDDVELVPYGSSSNRSWAPRSVVIEHFSETLTASTGRFQHPAFAVHLESIGRHIAETAGERHIWTTNNAGSIPTAAVFGRLDITGQRLSPCQAGSNAFSTCTEASMIYSANPSPAEVAILAARGIDKSSVRDSRELYAILQFVMRTSLRDPLSTEEVVLRVFSRDQSDRLRERLLKAFPTFIVEQRHIDVGIVENPKACAGEQPTQKLSAAERKARQAAYSAKHYAKKKRRKTMGETKYG